MNNEIRRPKVGLGVFVFKGDHFLLGLRKGAHGSGTWALPGGHMEWFETYEDTARREVLEEADLEIQNFRFITATNDIFQDEEKHYITIITAANWIEGEPKNMEPHKLVEWRWFKWGNQMPDNLFIPTANFMKLGIDPREKLNLC